MNRIRKQSSREIPNWKGKGRGKKRKKGKRRKVLVIPSLVPNMTTERSNVPDQ